MATRTARAHLHYTPNEVFDLVADVEQYPKFLPWFISAKVFRRREQTIWVDMTMGTRFFHKRFTTVAQLARPHRIYIDSRDPLFEHFEQNWTFELAASGVVVQSNTISESGTAIEFSCHTGTVSGNTISEAVIGLDTVPAAFVGANTFESVGTNRTGGGC